MSWRRGRHGGPPVRTGDTLRWHGVLVEDHSGGGLTIADYRQFLADADAAAAEAAVSIEDQVPTVGTWDRGGAPAGSVRDIWVGITRRKRRQPGELAPPRRVMR